MADLFNSNNNITIMKFEHAKLVAQANLQARQIRILELQEEIKRCENDIEAQKKVIAEQDKNIKIQIEADNKKESETSS